MSDLIERLDRLPREMFEYVLLSGPAHWAAAGQTERLYRLLTDFCFLAVKIKEFKTNSLLDNYDLILSAGNASPRERGQAAEKVMSEAGPTPPDSDLITLLKRVLSQASHLLNRGESLEEVASTLHSRILSIPALAGFIADGERGWPKLLITAREPLPDMPHPALTRTLSGHTHWPNDCAVSADGSVMVSVSLYGEMIVWDVGTGDILWSRKDSEGASKCAVSADGSFVVSVSGKTLYFWGVRSRALYRVIETGHEWEINRCVVSPDGQMAVTAAGDLKGKDNTLRVWKLRDDSDPLILRGHGQAVNDCAIGADGRTIVSASNDRTLKVWDAHTGAERLTLRGHRARVNGCAISADGSVIVSAAGSSYRGGADNSLKLWDGASGRLLRTLRGHKGMVRSCAISADGSIVVSASADNTLKVWDAEGDAERLTLVGHTGANGGVKRCSISADGATLISAADNDKSVRVWNPRTQASLQDRLLPKFDNDQTGVLHCAISADGTSYVTTSGEGSLSNLTVWDSHGAQKRVTLIGHAQRVNGAAIHPQGTVVVSASEDKTLRVWKIRRRANSYKSRAPLLILAGHQDGPLRPSPHRIFRAFMTEGEPEYRGWVNKCALNQNGTFIVSASADRTLKIWDAVTGDERLTLRGHTEAVYDCAISKDDSFIVSASGDKTLKVWDAATGDERLTLFGHTGWVSSCAISSDKTFIVSASADVTLKVWKVSDGSEQMTLRGHTDVITDCEIDQTGKMILSTSQDGRLKLWEVSSGECLATLRVDGGLNACAWFPGGKHILATGSRGIYLLRLTGSGAKSQ